jgi:hypothetical protein
MTHRYLELSVTDLRVFLLPSVLAVVVLRVPPFMVVSTLRLMLLELEWHCTRYTQLQAVLVMKVQHIYSVVTVKEPTLLWVLGLT